MRLTEFENVGRLEVGRLEVGGVENVNQTKQVSVN
jgi:hypothetical protein